MTMDGLVYALMRCKSCNGKYAVLNPSTDTWAVMRIESIIDEGGWTEASDKPVCPKCGGELVVEIDVAVHVGVGWLNVGKRDPVFTDEAIKN